MENKKEKIAAVVVTYNRKELLKECLDSLLKQTHPLDSIIIMNNASTDGTEEMLKKKYLGNPIFDYVNLGENLGGAGGFHYGIKRAYEKKFDWVWCMDDDVVAIKDAVNKYLKYKFISKFIQGRRINEDKSISKWAKRLNYRTGKKIWLNENQLFKNKDYIKINVGCFEGAFISRGMIKKIGLPDKNFFICEDDTIYGYLASKYSNVIYIKDITLIRNIKFNYKYLLHEKIMNKNPLNIYYLIRNSFLLEYKIKKIESGKKINHKKEIMLKIIKEGVKIILTQKEKKRLLKALFYGYMDGVKCDFEPRKFFTLNI